MNNEYGIHLLYTCTGNEITRYAVTVTPGDCMNSVYGMYVFSFYWNADNTEGPYMCFMLGTSNKTHITIACNSDTNEMKFFFDKWIVRTDTSVVYSDTYQIYMGSSYTDNCSIAQDDYLMPYQIFGIL